MDRADAEKRVIDIVAVQVSTPESLSSSTTFESLRLDSLDYIELVLAFEEAFEKEVGREITEEEVKGWKTIGDVTDFVLRAADLTGCN